MKIKRYALKDGTTLKDIKNVGGREGGTWINNESELFISKCFYYKPLDFEFSIGIAFKKDILDWDDYANVLVLDEDFCQPYISFYGENFGKDITGSPVLEHCIKQYNEYMDSFPFLVETKKL